MAPLLLNGLLSLGEDRDLGGLIMPRTIVSLAELINRAGLFCFFSAFW